MRHWRKHSRTAGSSPALQACRASGLKTLEAPGGMSRQRQDSELQAELMATGLVSGEEAHDSSGETPHPKRARVGGSES